MLSINIRKILIVAVIILVFASLYIFYQNILNMCCLGPWILLILIILMVLISKTGGGK